MYDEEQEDELIWTIWQTSKFDNIWVSNTQKILLHVLWEEAVSPKECYAIACALVFLGRFPKVTKSLSLSVAIVKQTESSSHFVDFTITPYDISYSMGMEDSKDITSRTVYRHTPGGPAEGDPFKDLELWFELSYELLRGKVKVTVDSSLIDDDDVVNWDPYIGIPRF